MRELRDRSIEEINLAPGMLLSPAANGKFDVSRQLTPGYPDSGPGSAPMKLQTTKLLDAA